MKFLKNLIILFVLFGNSFFVSTKTQPSIVPVQQKSNIECLTKIVYFEAGNQSLIGKIAVAYVVHNRTISKKFPNDYCSVIFQKNQFSNINKNIRYMKNYLESECVAKSFILLPDPTKGALYFHNKHIGKDWVKNRKRGIVIEDHLFY
jgi:spore germination cell wall hydrolase CwlJ-like protein